MTAAEQDCVGPDWLAGRALLEHHARSGRTFTANELRPALRALGFGRFDSGALFMAAKADGVIRKVGVEASTDGPTHGAYVRRWTGAAHVPSSEVVTVPVQRDRGRFTSTAPAPTADGPTLLTFLEQS